MSDNELILFLDESGKTSFSHSSSYFVVSACAIPTNKLVDIRNSANNIIFKYWGTKKNYGRKYGINKFIFHSRDIATFRNQFQVLSNPKTNREFGDDLYSQLLSRSCINYHIALIDKPEIRRRHPTWTPQTTLNKSYSYILEKFVTQLINMGKTGRIIAESSSDQDLSLVTVLSQFQRTSRRRFGSSTLVNEKVTALSLVNKHNDSIGAQIADLIAWTGINKYRIDQGVTTLDSLDYSAKKILNMFNRKLANRSGRNGYSTFSNITQ